MRSTLLSCFIAFVICFASVSKVSMAYALSEHQEGDVLSVQVSHESIDIEMSQNHNEDDPCCDVECCEQECFCPANACASLLAISENASLQRYLRPQNKRDKLIVKQPNKPSTALYRPPIDAVLP